VATQEGRVVKVEGNPLHPLNSGKLCIRGQASLQGLYDPDRIRGPMKKVAPGRHVPISWDEALGLLAEKVKSMPREKTVFLSSLQTGSLGQLLQTWCASLGVKPPIFYEPISYEDIREANRITFGEKAVPSFRLQDAKVLFSFGADFLETYLSPVEYSRAYSERHALGQGGVCAHFSPRLSLTAANADEWVKIRPGTEAAVILSLIHTILDENLALLSVRGDVGRIRGMVADYAPEKVTGTAGVPPEKLVKLARVFGAHGPALALAGAGIGVQVAANLLNYITGNIGGTVQFGPASAYDKASPCSDVLNLVKDIRAGTIETLLVYEANPAYSLPPASGSKDALAVVPFMASFSSVMDETTELADLILPSHTPLESWGDHSPREGVFGLMQPAMNPVFQTKPIGDILLAVAQKVGGKASEAHPWPNFYEYLRDAWKGRGSRVKGQDYEEFWQRSLQQGGAWESVPVKPVKLSPEALKADFSAASSGPEDGISLLVYPSSRYYDGRGANKLWLHETPDPMTQVVWDSWVEINPDTANRLGIRPGHLVQVATPQGSIEAPAYLYPGIHPEAVAIPMGLGHTAGGEAATGKGVNPFLLLSPEANPLVKATLAPTGQSYRLVSPQGSDTQEGRGIAQAVLLVDLDREAEPKGPEPHRPPPMYKPHVHPKHRWGMVIDLDRCTGCGACIAACYAENNIAVVGKEQITKRRQMAWIWIERFLETDGSVRFLPMLCQQCDFAPCEPVCPVFAAYHTPEGLNAQVYNRCVGTRYCANNCPYKVRRFNWFEPVWREPLNWQLNPDVTPREKGVMEKCNFCVQRIAAGKDRAKDEGREVRDGEIIPACAQTCPSGAIVFGDLKDPRSLVSRLSGDKRRYRVLEGLNTEPAITYLKKVTGRLA
jgi:molybdopterin-containing oxidoreductase family iron-sulfur binding subunit